MSDLIDRQAAIDALRAIKHGLWEIDIPSPTVPEYVEHHEQIKNMMEIVDGWIKRVKEEPTIHPEPPKMGKWIAEDDAIISGRCSVCGWEAILYETDVFGMDYCPNCGAQMEGTE